jgi:hypothetical protein
MGSFSIVLLELVLPYLDIERCLREVAEVVRGGGLLHGVCHGPGYYLSAAWAEVFRLRSSALRRVAVLLYTVVHKLACLERYRFETFQTPRQIRTALLSVGFGDVEIGLGGHPFDPRLGVPAIPVFFWFRARRGRNPP